MRERTFGRKSIGKGVWHLLDSLQHPYCDDHLSVVERTKEQPTGGFCKRCFPETKDGSPPDPPGLLRSRL